MICKSLKTNKYFNYSFNGPFKNVELNDGMDNKFMIHYKEWCKDYLIIDKWRNLNEWDIKYNKEIENGKLSSS